jgi:ligand-binding sensor domain-containing protein
LHLYKISLFHVYCIFVIQFYKMSKKSLLVYVLLYTWFGFCQNNSQWKGYFSYNEIKDISLTTSFLFGASENAMFSKDLATGDLSTINSIDGLKAEVISTIHRSDAFQLTLVGNKNGLLIVVKDNGTIIPKRGIIDEVPVSPLLKNINHFLEYNGKIFISCDYGISVFDLTSLEFENTYYMGPLGANIAVAQTAINNGFIYAATSFPSGSGIRRADLSNQFLDDFNQWVDISGFYWKGITTFNNTIYAYRTDNKLYKYDGTSFTQLIQYNQAFLDLRSTADYLTTTFSNDVFVYNQAMQLVVHVQSNQILGDPVTFTCASVMNDIIYIGTKERGIITATISNPLSFEEIKPDGPIYNNIFRVKKSTSTLWALYGRYNRTYNPYNPDPPYQPYSFPISKYTLENGWDFIPTTDLLNARALSNLAFNPNNENDFYVSSYFSGLLKVENEVPTILYNTTNTGADGLQSLSVGDGIRVNGPAYDKSGNLWMTNNFVEKGLKVLRANGSWQSYDLSNVITESTLESYALLVIDKNGTKWLPTSRNGLIAYNETLNKSLVIKTEGQGNLPEIDVRCATIDNRNQLWIGTARGLRIITSVDQFVSQDEIQTKAIIINEIIDGEELAQELFNQQFIVDIAVDGANRKWVSLADGGVYLVSSNGQETIYKFTKENSPLPSDNINDIEIDSLTGEVFFATDKGLVSFKGTATGPKDDLGNVFIYPNPVRPEFNGSVKIAGLTDKANIKIADIEGNLVYETTSAGGTIEWDTTAFGKYKVASGVYMVFIAAQDGVETTVKKVMIIR